MAPPPSAPSRGEVITFYSYKGGTGRTMALANAACLLAERAGTGQRILVVDWDLEAPGLHRFLPPRLAPSGPDPELGLGAAAGLIDLFTALDAAVPPTPAETEEEADEAAEAALAKTEIESFVADTAVPGVSIMRAGRNDDGRYSRRVGTFNWEGLFHRAPSLYRRVAERLAESFRYVLIDSRTGVTDISGISTSLLPEKLVVVFTPNRQSLSGVRDLIERATSYRRNSDDLRPLLVLPLPSRIEASLQDLRARWRFGSRDHNVVGYQPMFEELFASCYGLERCDLTAYFDEVQIQQTPDYAYGEEIAVRGGSDRFSLANSYRVFVDRLVSSAPPWASEKEPVKPVAPPPAPAPAGQGQAPPARQPALPGAGPKVFLSFSPHDRERVEPIARLLEASGFDVWWDRSLPAGNTFDRAVEQALDASAAVVVCWSKASVASQWVLAEAEEGLRRGVLIPILLDDVAPPLGFRAIQSVDLRRDVESGTMELRRAVDRVARQSPGRPASSPRVARGGRLWWAAAAAVVLALGTGALLLRRPQAAPASPSPVPTGVAATPFATPPAQVRVPNFVGSQAADVRKAAGYLGLQVAFKDERGVESASLEGVVVAQEPAADGSAARGSTVRVTVAAETVTVPTVVGKTLDSAVAAMSAARLRLTTKGFRPVTDVKPGTIIEQSPTSGSKAAVGSQVSVTVASSPRQSLQK